MKVCARYSHLGAVEILTGNKNILCEIEEILNDESLNFGQDGPRLIKQEIYRKFNQKGWADRVRVGNSKLTVSFLKTRVGICIQLGNVARTYADILKLSQLGARNIIEVGIIIVPDSLESKLLGANYARYDRLTKEMQHFSEIIRTPILIVGLSN